MFRFRHSRIDPGFFLALLIPIFAIYPLLEPGLPDTFDGRMHLYRVVELDQAWRDGVFFPRWAPDLVFGYGMALFNFEPPLLYVLAEALHLLGLTFQAALKWVLMGCFLSYSLGMYIFTREIMGVGAGLLAAAAYVYTPFRMREAFLFEGSYTQFLAFSLGPWVLWSLHRLACSGNRFRFVLAASLSGLFFLSHNVTSMLWLPLFVAYPLFTALVWRSWRPAWRCLAALGFGLGLAAFFLLPAVLEKSWSQAHLLTQGFFDLRQHFVGLRELFSLNVPLDRRSHNPYMPHNLGTAQLILGVLGLLLLLGWRRLPRSFRLHLAFFALVLVVSAFMMLSPSRVIWDAVPLLRFAERPWRMQGIVALAAAYLAGASLHWWRGAGSRFRLGFLTLALAFVIVASFVYFYPRPFLDLSGASPAQIVAYEQSRGALGTTSAGEYLSIWTLKRPTTSPLVPLYQAGEPITKLDREALPSSVKADLLRHSVISDEYSFTSPAPFTAHFHTFYFPGWQAYLDGRPVSLDITSPSGLMAVEVPAGSHRILLRFEDTPTRRAANILSLGSLLVLGSIVALRRGRGSEPAAADQSLQMGISWPGAGFIAIAMLALLLVKAAFIDAHTLWFRRLSPPERVSGCQHPAHVNLEGNVLFLGYDLDGGVVKQGESLHLTLYWQSLKPLARDWSSFAHFDSFPLYLTRLTADNVHPGDIPVSLWDPHLYVRDDYLIRIPDDMPPIAYLLRVGLYDRAAGQPLKVQEESGESGDSAIALTTVNVVNRKPLAPKDLPNGQKRYLLGGQISLLGYQLASNSVWSGESLAVTLFWRAEGKIPTNYTVFVHLLDETRHLQAQGDSPPLGSMYPTSTWLPGQVIEDRYQIPIASGVASGRYRVAVGMYDVNTMERLMIEGPEGPLRDDMVFLEEPVEVRAGP